MAETYKRTMRVIALLVMLVTAYESSAGRVRAVGSWQPRRILLVIAHPDDELLFAPYLGPRCATGAAACQILVLTRGENGGDPNVRAQEMAASAALLHATLVSYAHADIMTPWVERDAIVREIDDAIASFRPDTIFTLDPEHGSTGHPAHRETGSLVLASNAHNVYLLQTRAEFTGAGFVLWPSREDAWAPIVDWEWAVTIAEIHRSQFTPEQVSSLRSLRAEQRHVWLIRMR